MARIEHNFPDPDRCVVGTVGMPGQRTFFLQARQERRLISVALEKQQVMVLAERINDLLDELAADGRIEAEVSEVSDLAGLAQPIEEEFRVGALSLGWSPDDGRFVVEAHSAEDPGPDGLSQEELLRVSLTPERAREFASRALLVVAQGRPDCPFCGEPVESEGHLCVRANGFKRRTS